MKFLVSKGNPKILKSLVDYNNEIRCSAKYAKVTVFLLLSFSCSHFFSRLFFFLCLLMDIYIPLPKFHEINSFRTFPPYLQTKAVKTLEMGFIITTTIDLLSSTAFNFDRLNHL